MELNCPKKLQGQSQCLWLLGTPTAVEILFSWRKSLIKGLISSQLAEYLCFRNSIAWVNSDFFCESEARLHWVWWWENELCGHGEAENTSRGACELCHKMWAAWASWCCLQWLGHCRQTQLQQEGLKKSCNRSHLRYRCDGMSPSPQIRQVRGLNHKDDQSKNLQPMPLAHNQELRWNSGRPTPLFLEILGAWKYQ